MNISHLKCRIRRTTIKTPQVRASFTRMDNRSSHNSSTLLACLSLLVLLLTTLYSFAQQDWIRTGTGLGVEKVKLAVPDFKPSTSDGKNAELLKAFNDTLWNDLDNAGIFDLVSKSFYPMAAPGQPSEVKFDAWSGTPVNASMMAFG